MAPWWETFFDGDYLRISGSTSEPFPTGGVPSSTRLGLLAVRP